MHALSDQTALSDQQWSQEGPGHNFTIIHKIDKYKVAAEVTRRMLT